MPQTDTAASVAFLLWAAPEGPWNLTAISPETRDTETRTFTSTEDAAAWVSQVQSRETKCGKGWNVYFMVNPARAPLRKKASKEDVEALAFLHVDVDPPKGQPLGPARAAILERLEAFEPRPSAVIDSGGDYQAFWRLDDALYIGGSEVRWAEAEAYNQQLELVLGGDHCWNIDRIMRLPGTVNVPDAKKAAAGREPALAAVIWAEDTVYPLHTFMPAPRVAAQEGGSAPVGTVKLSGNLKPVTLEELPEGVTPRMRALIQHGYDPDDITKYASRSEATWAISCSLVRAGCTDDTIASVLLDREFGISAHCLAQRRSVEYAARQIARAREEVEEPWLRKLNERHAVIADLGGKCRIISEVSDPVMRRSRLSKQSFEDFRNRYLNHFVQVGSDAKGKPIFKSAGTWWLAHPLRRQFESLVFAPGTEVDGAYNLWRGFACEAVPGQHHEPYLEHLHSNICGGRDDHYEYLLSWMARVVQNPAEAGEISIVLRGGMGAGKGTAVQGFGRLFGRHFLHINSARHLVGQFNAHLRDCVLLFADEAFFAGDKQHESVLKTMITEDTLVVEGKGVDAEVGPNYIHLMMASNKEWVVPAGADERRFFVVDVGEAQKQNATYFGKIARAMSNGGAESLLHFLMTRDLSGYEVRAVPQTEALRDQKLYSLGPEESWWLERLMDGRITAASREWLTSVTKERLQGDYVRHCEQLRSFRRAAPTALGRFLSRVMGEGWPRSVQRLTDVEKTGPDGRIEVVRERVYFYDLPDLAACRASWERLYGRFDWPGEDDRPARANEGAPF